MKFGACNFAVINESSGAWLSFALLVIDVETKQSVFQFSITCSREKGEWSEKALEFWRHGEGAGCLQIIESTHYQKMALEEAELGICSAVARAKRAHPHMFFLTRNFNSDVQLLDSILTKHGQPSIARRNDNLYLRTICTWSFRMGASVADTGANTGSRLPRFKCIDFGFFGPRHLPLSECAVTINRHFYVLNSKKVSNHNNSKNREKFIRAHLCQE